MLRIKFSDTSSSKPEIMKNILPIIVTAWAALVCDSLQAASAPLTIPAGTPDAFYFDGAQNCKEFFIRKTSTGWEVENSEKPDLQDPTIERLDGCIGYTGKIETRAIVFRVKAVDKCGTETACLINGMKQHPNNCNHAYHKEFYVANTPRSKGYYECNSNFATKGFFGGINFEKPVINYNLLASALASDSLKATASDFMNATFRRYLALAAQFDASTCGRCKDEMVNIRFIFDYFSEYASAEELEAVGTKFVEMTGEKSFPGWVSSRLAPASLQAIESNAKQAWRKKYAEQVEYVLGPSAKTIDLKRFVDKLEESKSDNWSTVDFDGVLPKAKQILAARIKKDEIDARERDKKWAEAQSAANNVKNAPTQRPTTSAANIQPVNFACTVRVSNAYATGHVFLVSSSEFIDSGDWLNKNSSEEKSYINKRTGEFRFQIDEQRAFSRIRKDSIGTCVTR